MDGPLNDLRLDGFLLESLYKTALVEVAAPLPADNPTLKYLGNHLQRVSIFVTEPDHTFLPEDKLNFLTRLLGACKMNTGDVAVVNLDRNPQKIPALISLLGSHKAISFNAPDEALRTDEIDGVPILYAPDLQYLIADTEQAKALKTRLWSSLKQFFALT